VTLPPSSQAANVASSCAISQPAPTAAMPEEAVKDGPPPLGVAASAQLGTGHAASEHPRMTSSASWLPAAAVRAAVVTSPPAQRVPTAGRHSAPELGSVSDSMATEIGRPGRHAEPEWSREVFDSLRDEDPLDWLGFSYVD
jgi:hypothetical protein